MSVSSFRVLQCLPCNLRKVIACKRLELEYSGTADKGGVHFKERVLRRGTNEYERPVLDPWKKCILLAFVPSVDLVHEEYGAFAVQIQPLLGFLDFVTQLLDSGQYGVYRREMAFCCIGDHSCKGCLPRSRRAVEDDGRQLVRLYGAS